MIPLLLTTIALGGLAAWFGLRHAWRQLDRIEREHTDVLLNDTHERQGEPR